MMHERIERYLLYCACSGEEPVLTPIEREIYESYRKTIAENPGKEIRIPTSYPDSGIKMRYAGNDGKGITVQEVTELSQKAEAVIALIERHGMICEDGFLTVGFDSRLNSHVRNRMTLKDGRLSLPTLGSALAGQLEEQLSYGIGAYTLRNFNPDEKYALKTIEEIVCRVVSVHILREMGFEDIAESVLAREGTYFECDTVGNAGEKSGDTQGDIRALAALFTWDDLVPFLRIRDYAVPYETVELRDLNTVALLANYPESKAVRTLCDIWKRIKYDTEDFIDYMMSDPYPD